MAEFFRVATLSEVPPGEVLGVEAAGKRICLANVEGEIYAFQDNCSHRDFPLSNGELDEDDCTITCDWHGAIFDIRTGAAVGLPATRPIMVYPAKVEGEEIWVEVG
ncbi:MAG: non-heme iron oxygenase ferredoxin subunit [Gemmatimonadota bacterium]|jgi:3-phenylpropionate/trans-cinnamate dioxygenase ferredoxin subunit|nr:non-heme iron oxygenase ferredoxin subunit [Gemmatimonadota bacterium]